MPIFAVDIAGKPTVVVAARDYVAALAFVGNSFIRSEMVSLRTPDGEPLCEGNADVAIRSASANEQAVWERSMAKDLAEGVHESREDAVESNGFAFLVEYREPDE